MDKRLEAVFRQARAIGLSKAESAAVKKQIFAMTPRSVRVKAASCHKGSMNDKAIFAAGKGIRLTPKEAHSVDAAIMQIVRMHPVQDPRGRHVREKPSPSSPDIFDVLRSFFVRPTPVFSVFIGAVFLFGTTVSAAAQSALPGDVLYPVKIHVNENVAASFRISPASRARFEVSRLEWRLQEAGQLAAAGSYRGKAKVQASAHIEHQVQETKRAASVLAERGDTYAAVEVNMRSESALHATRRVFTTVDVGDEDGKRIDVNDLLQTVTKAAHSMTRDRLIMEGVVNAATNVQIATAAEDRAAHTLDEVKITIDNVTSSVNSDVLAEAQAHLNVANEAMVNVRALPEMERAEALFLARKAFREAEEARFMLRFSSSVKVRSRTTSPSSEPPATEPAASSSSAISVAMESSAQAVSSEAPASADLGATIGAEVEQNIDAHLEEMDEKMEDLRQKLEF